MSTHQHIDARPASSMSRHRPRLTIAFFPDEDAAQRPPSSPTARFGIATGTAATISTKANCNVVRIGSPRTIATANNHRHQSYGKNDEVIADFQHGALKMADRMRGSCTSSARSAKGGIPTRGINQRADLALPDDRAKKISPSLYSLVAGNDLPVRAD